MFGSTGQAIFLKSAGATNGRSMAMPVSMDTDYWFEVDLTEDLQAVGLKMIGAIHFASECDDEKVLYADVQPFPPGYRQI